MGHLQPGTAVSFRLGDAVCLPVEGAEMEIIEALLQATFRGHVVFTAQADAGAGAFAAVEIEGLPRRLIVAVDRLSRVQPDGAPVEAGAVALQCVSDCT
jgi:hypothetical protein